MRVCVSWGVCNYAYACVVGGVIMRVCVCVVGCV